MKNIKIGLLVIPFLTGLVIFCLTMFFLAPRLGEIGRTKKGNRENQQSLNNLSLKVAALEQIDKDELQSRVEQVVAFLPAEKDIPKALVLSRALCQETGLTIKKISVSADEVSSSLPYFSVSITVETDWDKIIPFLERIETVSPLLNLEKVSLSSRGGSVVEISITVKNLFTDYPANIGTPESALPQITKEEEDVYQLIVQKYKPVLPPFASEVGINSPMGKTNPFSL